MPRIANEIFGAMRPRVAPTLLGVTAAQSARNIDILSGTMVPMKAPRAVSGVSMSGLSEIKTLYRFGQDVAPELNYWFQFTGDVDIVRGPIAGDTEERTYWTDGVFPKKTKSDLAGLIAGVAITPSALRMGVPSPGWNGPTGAATYTPTATVTGSATDPASTSSTAAYVVTYKTSWGEESAPSLPSNIVQWRLGQSVSLTLPGAFSGAYDITHVRIYRSNTGSANTDYQFLVELPVALASVVDAAPSSELGEVCPTWDFDPPPDGMIGLTDLGNGILAGFSGNTVHFCEPNYPYAWPSKYDFPVGAKIVGIKPFSQTLVVATVNGIVLINCTDPAAASAEYPKWGQVCVSKRSMVEGLGGVVYASREGLVLIGPSGPENLTAAAMDKQTWISYSPETMHGQIVSGMYHAFYSNGVTSGCLIFIPGEGGGFILSDQYVTATYVEKRTEAMYVVKRTGSVNQLAQWNDGASLTGLWRGRENLYHSSAQMAYAKVVARGYPLTYRLVLNGAVAHTKTVTNAIPFSLPDVTASTVAHEVESTHEVLSVRTASSAQELGDG